MSTTFFTIKDKTYELVVQAPDFVVGIFQGNVCCEEVIFVESATLAQKILHYKAEDLNAGIALWTAYYLLNSGKSMLKDHSGCMESDIYGAITLGSELIDGTSAGVKYLVLAKMRSGVVARRTVDKHGLTGTRIRVVPNHKEYLWNPPYYLNTETKLGWETQDNHLAEQGYNSERTTLVISHGIKLLLDLQKKA